MRRLTPYNHPGPLACLKYFYTKRYRGPRDVYEFQGLRRPKFAPEQPKRRSLWAWLRGK